MFKKILIANRGEIALRVICACRELGIKTVAVYSEADENSLHVRFADEDVCIGPARSADSYLNVPAVLSAAEITGADAIHPGYGFLAENPELADACVREGIIWVGPPKRVMERLGNKVEARAMAERAGEPVMPATGALPHDPAEARRLAEQVGFPLMVKASWGGGGRGMRMVHDPADLDEAVEAGRREARAASKIGHANIVDVTDSGTTPDGAFYFVMEFLDGTNLEELNDRNGPLPVERALLIADEGQRGLDGGEAAPAGRAHPDGGGGMSGEDIGARLDQFEARLTAQLDGLRDAVSAMHRQITSLQELMRDLRGDP